MKSLFIGAEGTLGVITAACLKLFPQPADTATALVGIDSPQRALELLVRLRGTAGDQVTSFELMPRRAVELTVQYVDGVADPLALEAAWYVLVELGSPNPRQELSALLADSLAQAAATGTVCDALIAASGRSPRRCGNCANRYRKRKRRHGASLKHDVSVPISALPRLVADGSRLVERLAPEGEVIAYGHVGDGNLHFNVSQTPRHATGRRSWPRRAALEAGHVRSGREPRRQHQRGARHRPARGRGVRAARRPGGACRHARSEARARSEAAS